MQLSESLPRNLRRYTPEELARAEARKRERLAADLGMCAADCPVCAGLGYTSDGSGIAQLCPNVDRWKLPSAARYGIDRKEAESLDWSDVLPVNGIDRAVDAVRRTLSWGFGWVYLYGDYGLGKTLLLKIAIAQTLRTGETGAYVRMSEILDHLRAGFDDKLEGESARLNWWSEIPILAIDEFDKLRETGYGDERRFVLMDRRYELATAKRGVTLIASNSAPEKLPGYLYDRVRDGRFTMVEIDGQSLRPGMKWEER